MPRITTSSSQLGDSVEQSEIEAAYRYAFVPVGGIIPWLKNLAGTPALPTGWAECNGQVLNDAASVYHGAALPDLNVTQRFLRGAPTSGTTGGADTHAHTFNPPNRQDNMDSVGTFDDVWYGNSGYSVSAGSTLPAFYEVVMIMRIK